MIRIFTVLGVGALLAFLWLSGSLPDTGKSSPPSAFTECGVGIDPTGGRCN